MDLGGLQASGVDGGDGGGSGIKDDFFPRSRLQDGVDLSYPEQKIIKVAVKLREDIIVDDPLVKGSCWVWQWN